MIVAGRVSQKMAPVLRQVYDQMMEPKWVISMGVCASTGGMFNNYAIVQGVDQVVPVDVYAPGCPPTPETLIHAIVTLHGLIENGEIMRRRGDTGAGARCHGRGGVERRADVVSACADRRCAAVPVRHDRHRPRRRPAPSPPGLSCCTAAGLVDARPGRCSIRTVSSTSELMRALARRRLRDVRRPVPRSTTSPTPSGRCPTASQPERFEVVVNLLDLDRQAPPAHARAGARRRPDAAVAVRPLPRHRGDGARGVRHVRHRVHDHPDLTRILMPEDWDRATRCARTTRSARIPVQFKLTGTPRGGRSQ